MTETAESDDTIDNDENDSRGILKNFLLIVVAALAQGFVATVVVKFLGLFLGLALPIFAGNVDMRTVELVGTGLCFLLISFVAGMRYPKHAFTRSALAVMLVTGGALLVYKYYNENILLASNEDIELVFTAAIIAGGLLCGITGWLGATGNDGLRQFIRDELDEFWESVGMKKIEEEE